MCSSMWKGIEILEQSSVNCFIAAWRRNLVYFVMLSGIIVVSSFDVNFFIGSDYINDEYQPGMKFQPSQGSDLFRV